MELAGLVIVWALALGLSAVVILTVGYFAVEFVKHVRKIRW